MLTSTSNKVQTKASTIKFLVRSALAFGVLTDAAEAKLNRLVTKGTLSSHDWMLVSVLRDAIEEGRVRVEKKPRYGSCLST